MDRVSIIIPCYNAGNYLVEAVASALAQTHADVEIIIVDDGSTDERTIHILETSHWPRTRVIRQANSGPAAARNRAIAAATGEYILPLDADDRIGPEYAAEALRVLRGRPEVGVVYCRAEKFGAEDGPWMLPAYNLRELVIDNVVFVTAMYRKEDWQRAGGYNEDLRHGVEDYDFWIKIVSLGREVVQLEGCHFFYRVQKESRTTGFSQNRGAMVRTYADIVRANAPFFLKNMEFIFEHRFGLYDELQHYRSRYSDIEVFLARFPIFRRAFDGLLGTLVRCLKVMQRMRKSMNRLIVVPVLGMLGLLGACRPEGGGEGRAQVPLTQAGQEHGRHESVVPAGVELESLLGAEWSRQACDLAVHGAENALTHRTGSPTVFEGFVIGPDEKPAGEFQLVLKAQNGAYSMSARTGLPRPDVASFFNNDDLVDAGFKFSSNLEGVPTGTYDIDFHMENAGKRYFCESGRQIRVE